ncbi:MAG: rod shape-determining protein RodA [Prolixibacteraceae bacterium]|nr:rod shape-determining protein RodA [Prolixibacteraceae bacterium]
MKSQNNIFLNIDWITILLYLVLVLMGWINIYAAVYSDEHQSILDIGQQYGKQMIWICAGIFLAVCVLIVDSKFYVAFAYHIYVLILFLLVAVLFLGREVNGARAWFEVGGVALQPAELAKFATSLAVAKYMSQFGFKMARTKSYIVLGTMMLLPALLILLQNDTGSALVFAVFFLVFYREGLPDVILIGGFTAIILFILALLWTQLQILILLIVVSLVLLIFLRQRFKDGIIGFVLVLLIYGILFGLKNLIGFDATPFQLMVLTSVLSVLAFIVYGLKNHIRQAWFVLLFFIFSIAITLSVNYFYSNILISHQRDRVDNLLGIKNDLRGAGWNVHQSKIAIGSGGIVGKGFLKGTQTKYNFVPEQSTDFIFCTVGEEWGFLGTTVVIFLFLTLLIRMIYLAERQRSTFSRIYGYSVACILFFHIVINVSMTIGLAPVIGIPLPFFSYGGSSLWSFTVLLFIFIKLDASRTKNLR